MFSRNIKPTLEKALKRSPITLLTGGRQTGKTTLIKEVGQTNNYTYVTFDDLRFLAAAQNDPIGFINGLSKPVILDEVQRVPEIFLTIKHDIDEHRIAGRYALTGSANPLLIPHLADSLVGRMEILELLPLSQGELIHVQETFINWAFNASLHISLDQTISRAELYYNITKGGYPSVQEVNEEDRNAWFNAYVTTLLQRDVQDLARISGLSEMPHLLQLLATRAGTLLNTADLSRTSTISSSTLHRYLALFQTLFLTYNLPAWSSNLGKRLVKSPKSYLVDSGLLAFLLNVTPQTISANFPFVGNILENFVVMELFKQTTWHKQRVNLFHYRTATGIEVDIVMEDAAGNLVGIEVKNSETVTGNDIKGLKYLQESVGPKFIKGIVLYTGSKIVPFGSNLMALPISSLWSGLLHNNESPAG